MPKLGVFTQWIHASSIEALTARISALDLHCVVLDSFPGLSFDLSKPDAQTAQHIKDAFASAGVEIAAVGDYCNLAHPDPEERARIHTRFRGAIELASMIGAPMVCTEGGTFHPRDEWDWDPANATEEAFQSLLEALRPLVAHAHQHNVIIGIEPYVMTIIHSPERAARLIQELNSSYVQIVADPAGMLSRETLNIQPTFLVKAFEMISPYLGLVHVEDCRPSPNPEEHFLWLGAGQGLIDYPVFMDLVVESGYRGPLILEHLKEDDLPAARDYVLKHWGEALARHQQKGEFSTDGK